MNDSKLEKVIKGLEYCIDYAQRVKDLINDVPCEGCPYVALKPLRAGQGDCIDALFKDAIALLKAQQPRVMTLDEVRAAEVVWLEQCEVCVCAIKIQNFDSGTMSFAYEYNNYTSFINIKPEYYGKVSRCWTGRPTLEQMQEAKWDD